MMNNTNQYGRSNQLMSDFTNDYFSMRIKTIIAPYEQKIVELQKEISQKDFEITVLKEKIFSLTNNQSNIFNNFNNMPINPMNQMNQMMYNNEEEWMKGFKMACNDLDFSKINLTFLYNNKEYNETCGMEEILKKVIKRICKRLSINPNYQKFIYNNKALYLNLKLSEAGISNASTIMIIGQNEEQYYYDDDLQPHLYFDNDKESEDEDENDKYNIIFMTTQGTKHSITFNPKDTIGFMIKKYLIRVGRYELIEKLNEKKNILAFLYNIHNLKINDETKIKDFFGENKNPKIVINDVNDLIGA